jgi:hypothetical protein
MSSRWISPVSTTSAPRTLLALAYDPVDESTGGRGYLTRAGSWTVSVARRIGAEWHREGDGFYPHDHQGALWERIDGSAHPSGSAYVVCPCASDCLTLADFWGRCDRGEVSLRLAEDTYKDRDGKKRKRQPHPLILSGSPDVIGWSVGRSEFRAVSSTNHFLGTMLELGRKVGMADPPAGRLLGRPTGHAQPDSAWTADTLLRAYTHAIDWWLSRSAGRWCDTIGAAAYQWWRTTIEKGDMLEHEQPSATAMERAAVFGGRAQLFWFGSAGVEGDEPADEPYLEPAVPIHTEGPCWKYDIRSMYGSILRDEMFPAKLSHRIESLAVDAIPAACKLFCLVATVRVRLDRPSLPFPDPARGLVYPIGEWWTTLTTPELLAAYGRGEIVAVGECWAYRRGRPFREFASQILTEREQARDRSDQLCEAFAKGIVNALGGRLARHFRGWSLIAGRHPSQRWGEYVEQGLDGTEVVRCRGVAGQLQHFITRDDRPGGPTACFAHVTAYGRVRIDRIMAVAGAGNVLWCDTDGLIVTTAGKDRLTAAGYGHGDAPGELRLVEEVRRFTGRTPKHYHTDAGWTLAGARGDFSPMDNHTVKCWVTANPVRSGIRPDGSGLPTVAPYLHLDAIPLSGVPGEDGWGIHPQVVDGSCQWPKPLTAGEAEEIVER